MLEWDIKPPKSNKQTNENTLAGNTDTTYSGADGDASEFEIRLC